MEVEFSLGEILSSDKLSEGVKSKLTYFFPFDNSLVIFL